MLLQPFYSLFKNLIFQLEPETAHKAVMELLRVSDLALPRPRFSKTAALRVFGKEFAHPIGLAAGFDKSGEYADVLSKMGFSFIEAGTFTPKPQAGNPKPRLFRYPAQRSLLNRMGFNNPGIRKGISNLNRNSLRLDRHKSSMKIAISIGKQKETPESKAVEDYTSMVEAIQENMNDSLRNRLPYIAVNISSPNTSGLRDLQDASSIGDFVRSLCQFTNLPIAVKLAPDFESTQDFQRTAEACVDAGCAALIVSNTTVDYSGLPQRKEPYSGGVSGALLGSLARRRFLEAKEVVKDSVPLIASGGIMTPDDILDRIQLGASLVQVYTGWIYYGPAMVEDTLKQLQGRLRNRL